MTLLSQKLSLNIYLKMKRKLINGIYIHKLYKILHILNNEKKMFLMKN